MKRATILWAAGGTLLSLLTIAALAVGLRSEPVIRVEETEVNAVVESMMAYLRACDYQGLSACLSGEPDLGQPPEPDTAEGRIYQAFAQSVEYAVLPGLGLEDNQLCLDMQVQCLDVDAVTRLLQELCEEHSAQREALMEMAETALEQCSQMTTRQIRLRLVRHDDGWRVLPTAQLQQLLTGFVCQ